MQAHIHRSKMRPWTLPDLSKLDPHLSREHTLKVVFNAAGSPDQQVAVLLKSYLRLVDKGVSEYQATTAALAGATTHQLLVAAGHLENCVLTMRRALRFAYRLKSLQSAPTPPRQAAIFQARTQESLIRVRDAIEHLDERLLNEQIPDGSPVVLLIDGDNLVIGDITLPARDLAAWLEAMYVFGKAITGFPNDA
jgi:hypothetical protein